ncbi:MAG: hypothetical protein ACD_10C00556G0002 [uncultured bacterium]|nr:MAG: hypothetical protein ACD_10C00556G0002 [uncultured bacterium]
MLKTGTLLFMVYQRHDFTAMGFKKWAAQADKTGRIMVADPVASRTKFAMCSFWNIPPSPVTVMKNSLALRTNGGFREFSLGLIGIVHGLLQQAVVANWLKSGLVMGIFHGHTPW